MKPVDQTKFGFGSGNCEAACIASILEIPLEDIPDFHGNDPTDAEAYWQNVRKWCEDKPFTIIPIKFSDGHDPKEFLKDCWVIASGPSPRGTEEWHRHAVVWKNGKIVHDPHPSRAGLKKIDVYDMFVIKDPKGVVK